MDSFSSTMQGVAQSAVVASFPDRPLTLREKRALEQLRLFCISNQITGFISYSEAADLVVSVLGEPSASAILRRLLRGVVSAAATAAGSSTPDDTIS